MNRREFADTAAKTFLGVTAAPLIASGERLPTAKNVIYLYMNGGMTHLDTFDPKPGAETQGPTRAIRTNVDGLIISENFPKLAHVMDKVAIIRSMSSTTGAHGEGQYLFHTSYKPRNTIKHPFLGAWVTKLQGKYNKTLPGSVGISTPSNLAGAGYLKAVHQPLVIGDPNQGLKNSKHQNLSKLDKRLDLLSKAEQNFMGRYSHLKSVKAYTEMYDDAISLMSSSDLEAFDLNKEDNYIRDQYGRDRFGQGVLLARRLIDRNVRFVEVQYGGWDTHVNNFISVPERTAIVDQALSTLIRDLEARGKLDETLIVLATEFGRTPRINQNAGRDHYPKAFSCLLAGGGIKGGIAYGKTDDKGETIIENRVTIQDFNATIAHAMGIDSSQIIHSPSGRPFKMANGGEYISDLFL